MYRKAWITFIVFAVAILTVSTPGNVEAADTGDLDAIILGLAEFSAGAQATVQISVQNNKIKDEIDPAAKLADVAQLYNAAVGVIATLNKGGAPVTVQTDKVMMGIIPCGIATPPIPFVIKVDQNADRGSYEMELVLTYKEITRIILGGQTNPYIPAKTLITWDNKTVKKNLKIVIKEDAALRFEVTKVEPAVQPGARTEIRITFKNRSNEMVRAAVARISITDPLSPTDDTAFLGDLKSDSSAVGIFGIKVNGDAMLKEYPLDVQIKYTDSAGQERISKVLKVPVKVSPGISILPEIISSNLPAGLIGAAIVGVIWLIWFFVTKVEPLS